MPAVNDIDGPEKKALLLELGRIFIPKDVDMPCFASRSTAGPDAGSSSYVFQFGDHRVKLEVSRDPGCRLRLYQDSADGSMSIMLDGRSMVENVHVLPTPAHAPNQAFINLDSRCIMDCAFCTSARMERGINSQMSAERVLRIVEISAKCRNFAGVALTSGVPDSASETNRRMADMVRAIRARYPLLPIGVEVYVEDPDDIGLLKEAGATEIKINIETWPPEIFARVCPRRDRQAVLRALERAVEVFGRGRVHSNYIIGMGETDAQVIEGLEALAGMGVLPNVRGIRVGELNAKRLEKALGFTPERVKADRLLAIARKHKQILEKHGLDTRTTETMCFSCQCCDIVPMIDL